MILQGIDFFYGMFSLKFGNKNWLIWQAYFVYRPDPSILIETYYLQWV